MMIADAPLPHLCSVPCSTLHAEARARHAVRTELGLSQCESCGRELCVHTAVVEGHVTRCESCVRAPIFRHVAF